MEAEERRGRGGGFGKRGSRARELRLGGVTELWEGRLFKAGGETKDVLRRSRSVSVAGAGRGVSLVRRRPGVWLVAGTGRWGWGVSLLARYSSVRASAAQSSNSGGGRPGQRGSQAGAGPHPRTETEALGSGSRGAGQPGDVSKRARGERILFFLEGSSWRRREEKTSRAAWRRGQERDFGGVPALPEITRPTR